jgi:hypothetical protein
LGEHSVVFVEVALLLLHFFLSKFELLELTLVFREFFVETLRLLLFLSGFVLYTVDFGEDLTDLVLLLRD